MIMSLPRHVEPEWLDELNPGNPAAIESRRDLRRLNVCMGSAGILANALKPVAAHGVKTMVELGAGDGWLALQVARRLGQSWRGTRLLLIDQAPMESLAVDEELTRLGWNVERIQAEAIGWIENQSGRYEIIFANLFLHHFEDSTLEQLFRSIARSTRYFAALEPRRSRLAGLFSRFVGVIGCNAVTRHDAVASVEAGFAGTELSRLWQPKPGWELQELDAGLFSHLFTSRDKRSS